MQRRTLAMATDASVQNERHRRPTRRDAFLMTRERVAFWLRCCDVIE
jgi:hypothetical protein